MIQKKDLFIFWNAFLLLMIGIVLFRMPSDLSPTGFSVIEKTDPAQKFNFFFLVALAVAAIIVTVILMDVYKKKPQ